MPTAASLQPLIGPFAAALDGVLLLTVALWMLTALTTTLMTFLYYWKARRAWGKPREQPCCVVLSPVKGASPTLGQFAAALLGQDYLNYRVVFVVESEADPAFFPLDRAARGSGGRAEVIVAGLASNCGQKVHNLAMALRRLQPTDAIVVFADGDFVPPADWLMQLTRSIARGHADIATGYVLMVPRSARPASLAASLISLGIATVFAPRRYRLCSGASTAIRRTVLEAMHPESFLAQTLSDDLSLSRAAYRNGIGIYTSLAVRVPTPTEHSWCSLFAYLRRQYQIVRIYAPMHWAFAAYALLLSPAGVAAAAMLALSGHAAGFGALAAAWALQQARFVMRHRALRRILDPAVVANLQPVFLLAHLIGPLVQIPHIIGFLASSFGRTIRWAGITYRVTGPERMQIVERAETT